MNVRVLIFGGAIGSLIVGCAHTPGNDSRMPTEWTAPLAATSTDEPPPWPFWPVRMRIHPLTRVAMDSGSEQLVIEARLEFLDADGHTTRATGQVLFQLMNGPNESDDAPPRRAWPEQDLRDLKVNRTRFDDVTSTYLFPIDVDRDDLADGPELRAYFVSSNGAMMKDRFTIQN
jgi:hypothetical protein